MPTAACRLVPFALLAALLTSPAVAQPDDPKDLQQKFQAERESALKAKFSAELLARADDFAKRAEAALKADNPKAAARYLRDARWQLPYLPPGLPDHVVRVFGESRMRHADRVNAVAYSPDGTRLASVSRDGSAKVWDLGNGREIATYRGHMDQPDDPTRNSTNVLGVTDVAFHPKEKVVASSCGNQIHLWDPETGKSVKTLLHLGKTDKPIKTLAYSPDGKSMAVGSDDGILRVIDSDTGKVKNTYPPRNARIEQLAYSPNGNMIVIGDSNGQVAVYAPAQSNALAMAVQGVDLGEVFGVAFTSDNGGVFTCGKDGKARLIAGPKPDGTSAGNTAAEQRKYVGHNGAVTSLTTSGETFLITGGDDKTVRVWDILSARQFRTFHGHMTAVSALSARSDGKQIASGSEDGAIRLWDLNTTDEHRAMTDATDSLWAVAYSPDGKRVAAAGSDLSIRVYNPETGKLEATLTGAKSPITSLAFLPDSNRLVSAGGDRTISVWDVAKQKLIRGLEGHESAVMAVAVADDGKLIVSAGAVGDRTVRGFTLEGEKAEWTWTARSAVCAVAVRKGTKHVAAGLADGSLVTLDISGMTPKETSLTAHVAGVACVAYSPDGNRLASVGGDGILRVWAVAENGTFTPLVKFDGQAKPGSVGTFTPLTGVAFSPDGRYVATVGADPVVRVWDVETKSEVRGLRGHTDWVTAVAFSPDGRYLASVGVEKDHALRVFELPPLDTTATGGHLLSVNAIAVSPDGKIVATASTDQTIKLWELATGKLLGTLIGNSDIPASIAFQGNNALVMGSIIPSSVTGRLHFWRTTPPAQISTVETGEVCAVAATPDGAKFAAWITRQAVGDGIKNNTYELFDPKGGPLSEPQADRGRKVQAVSFTADLQWAVAGDDQGTIRIWNLTKKGERIGDDFPLMVNEIVDVGITPDKKLIAAVDNKGLVKVANVADQKKREVIGSFTPHKSGVRTLQMSPSGTTLVTVGTDREIKAWSLAAGDLKDPKPSRSWSLPVNVNSVAFTPNGKYLVTANVDGTVYVLELPGGDMN